MIRLSRRRSAFRRIAPLVVLASVLAAFPPAATEPTSEPRSSASPPTTVIVVRHTEKESEPEDPPLSAAGQARAHELARMLADVEPSALYASQYRRATQTLEPLAETTGLTVRIVPLAADDLSGQLRAMAEGILQDHRGATVVVSGHSNTVPGLIEAFGVPDPPLLDDDEYDDLFVVSVATDGSAQMLHLHYGEVSP